MPVPLKARPAGPFAGLVTPARPERLLPLAPPPCRLGGNDNGEDRTGKDQGAAATAGHTGAARQWQRGSEARQPAGGAGSHAVFVVTGCLLFTRARGCANPSAHEWRVNPSAYGPWLNGPPPPPPKLTSP